MPYITQKQREKFKNLNCISDLIDNEGELNFVISTLLNNYVKNNKSNYSTYNTIMGVMSCALHEFYRKNISLYEDKKEKENGKLY